MFCRGRQALKGRVEPHIGKEAGSIGVEVHEGTGSRGEAAALTLAQRRKASQLCEKGFQLIKIMFGRVAQPPGSGVSLCQRNLPRAARDQRCSMRPKRQMARATTQVATNSATMMKPASLMLKLAK